MNWIRRVCPAGIAAGLFPLLASAHPGHPGHELVADPGTAIASLLVLVAVIVAACWRQRRAGSRDSF